MSDEKPITPGCPSLMPHNLPGGLDGVEPGEDNKAGGKTEVDVLRECLKEAIQCYCENVAIDGHGETHFCEFLEGDLCTSDGSCDCKRWRNALNGGRK